MNNNVFLSLELCLFFVVLMAHLLRILASIQSSRNLRPSLPLKSYLLFKSVDISDCLGDEFDKSARFQTPTTVNEIEQRERDNSKENSTKYRLVGKCLSSLG